MSTGTPRVLVTGGTGFLGRPVVRRLVSSGYSVRVLTRTREKGPMIRDLGAEACVGDVADLSSFDRAMAGCEVIVHLAAGTSGSASDSETATVQGTRNLLTLSANHGVNRLVYISSCSVYGVAQSTVDARITETSSLEPSPERRGSYTASKIEAERYVREFAEAGRLPTVILRPGIIHGPGGPLFTPMIGFAAGPVYVAIGMGDLLLPLVYVDNLVDAIVLSMEQDSAVGQIFNVVDPEPLQKRRYIDGVVRRVHPRARVAYVPFGLIYAATWLQERMSALLKRQPVLSCYRLSSSQAPARYDSSLIERRLGWRARVSIDEAMNRIVASELSRRGAAAVTPAGTLASNGSAAKGSAG